MTTQGGVERAPLKNMELQLCILVHHFGAEAKIN